MTERDANVSRAQRGAVGKATSAPWLVVRSTQMDCGGAAHCPSEHGRFMWLRPRRQRFGCPTLQRHSNPASVRLHAPEAQAALQHACIPWRAGSVESYRGRHQEAVVGAILTRLPRAVYWFGSGNCCWLTTWFA